MWFSTVTDGPSFRVLLPEHIKAEEYEEYGGLHGIPGGWEIRADGIEGGYRLKDDFEFRVGISSDDGEMRISLGVKNLLDRTLHDITVAICASVNHLPGAPGWCNDDFLPGLELDRDVQGRYWYGKVTPEGLIALTTRGRVMMHPRRGNPDPDAVPQYEHIASENPCAYACVARNEDGSRSFYQAWNRECYWTAPFRGNACMHLMPVVARELKPGEESVMDGIVGIAAGDVERAVNRIEGFRREKMNP